MHSLSLELLRGAVDPGIVGFSQTTLKSGPAPARVCRLDLAYRQGHSGVSSVIAKVMEPDWPDDPDGTDRENRFYERVLAHMDVPHARMLYAGIDPATQHRLLILEDLSPGYVFQPVGHCWTPDELECILRAYARLHVVGQAALPPPEACGWLMPRHEACLDAAALLRLAEDLRERRLLSPLPKLGILIERTIAQARGARLLPATLLHNDVYPTNVALPGDLTRDAVLIDWQMAGWGLPELDLAYLFMQPFRNARAISRRRALAYYWEQWLRLDGTRMSPALQDERALYAEALLALSFLPAALRVAQHPFAERTPARAYWDAMYRVLDERFLELCR